MVHIQKQHQKSMFYYANHERAIALPDKYLSIIGGMDQWKTCRPTYLFFLEKIWQNFVYIVDQHNFIYIVSSTYTSWS